MSFIRINDCGQGVNKDLLPEELTVGMWSDCSNMRFQKGFAERMGGLVNIFDTPTVVPYFVIPYINQSTRFWIHAGLAKVFADDGSARTEITPAVAPTGGVDDRWTGTVLNGVLVMNNGVNVPWYWGGDTSTDLTTLPGWTNTHRAEAIRAYKGALVAINITKGTDRYTSMVKTSSVANPGDIPSSWDETDPTTLAREFDLSETSDECIDLLAMGDQMIIYKNASMYAMTLGSSDEVYRFQRLPGSDGIMAKGCVVDTPFGHVVLTANDVVIHQGQGAKSIADGVIKDFIFNNINRTASNRAFLCVNPGAKEVLVCFPSEASETCDLCAVWNWRYQTWGIRSLPNVTYGDTGQIDVQSALFSWDSDTDSWDSDTTSWSDTDFSPNENRVLFSRDTGLTAFDVGTSELGETMNAYIERKGISFEDAGTKVLLCKGAIPRIDAPAGTVIPIQLGAHMVPEEDPTYADPVNFTVGTDYKIDSMVSGKYLAAKIGGEVDAIWKIRSFALDIEVMGTY